MKLSCIQTCGDVHAGSGRLSLNIVCAMLRYSVHHRFALPSIVNNHAKSRKHFCQLVCLIFLHSPPVGKEIQPMHTRHGIFVNNPQLRQIPGGGRNVEETPLHDRVKAACGRTA